MPIIDQLFIDLKEFRCGCHLSNTSMGALSYADDITLQSIRGLNKMIDICEMLAERFNILVNCKKTVCIQFGEIHNDREHVYLDN